MDLETLRDHYGSPSELAVAKQITHIDQHAQRFIELSPFLIIGTMGADGLGDVSPKGDAPGFVQVLDKKTLMIPDRLGNNRIDTLSNLASNAGVGPIIYDSRCNRNPENQRHSKHHYERGLTANNSSKRQNA